MAAAMAMLALLLVSCGGDGSVTLPSPTGSGTAGLPSRTASLEGPTRSASRSEPAAGATSEPTSTASTSSSSEETPTASSTDGSSAPSWAWWLLAGLGLLAAVLALILVPRARRRNTWDTAGRSGARGTVARTRAHAGAATGDSTAEVAGGWRVAAGRVVVLEDRLTGLSSAAPDEERARRARDLRDAVRDARHGMDTGLISENATALAGELARIAAQLSATLEASERVA